MRENAVRDACEREPGAGGAPRGGQARLAGRSSTPYTPGKRHSRQSRAGRVAPGRGGRGRRSEERRCVARGVARSSSPRASGSARRPRAPAARTTLSRPQPAVTTTDDVSRDMSLSAHRRRSDQTLRGYVPVPPRRQSARQPRARACRSQSATCRATRRTRVRCDADHRDRTADRAVDRLVGGRWIGSVAEGIGEAAEGLRRRRLAVVVFVISAFGCDLRQATRAGGWRRSWQRAADRLWRGRAGGYVMQAIGIAVAMR
jgi:hypothetical protein